MSPGLWCQGPEVCTPIIDANLHPTTSVVLRQLENCPPKQEFVCWPHPETFSIFHFLFLLSFVLFLSLFLKLTQPSEKVVVGIENDGP